MRIAGLPAVYNYWIKGINAMAWYQSIMSRNKFKSIVYFLCLADSSKEIPVSQPGYVSLHKLGGLHIELNRLFIMILSSVQCLSTDQQMIGTKSICSFIEYMPQKPTKFGIKSCGLCESLSGYCLQFQVYTWKLIMSQNKAYHIKLSSTFYQSTFEKNTTSILILFTPVWGW